MSQTTLSQLFGIFLKSYLLQKWQKGMIWRISNRNRTENKILIVSKSFWCHITLNWSKIHDFSLFFFYFIYEFFESKLLDLIASKKVKSTSTDEKCPPETKCGDMAHGSLFLFNGVNEVTATENAQVIIADVIISNSFS